MNRADDMYSGYVSTAGKFDVTDTAKLFWTGRSQAVRLPKAYRFDASEVHISRDGHSVILRAPTNSVHMASLADDSANTIEALRSAIDEGVRSGEPEPWDANEIKRAARSND